MLNQILQTLVCALLLLMSARQYQAAKANARR